MNDTQFAAASKYAEQRGREAGKAAASWVFDGNTTDAAYRRVLRGLDIGDPEVLDQLPGPDLSGQFADTLTGPQLTAEALEAAGVDEEDDSDNLTILCDIFEAEFYIGRDDELLRVARYHLGRK